MEFKFLDELQGHVSAEEKLEAIERVYRANKKQLFTAYMLFLILGLGVLGLHRFYLGDKRAAYILLGFSGLAFFPNLIFALFELRGTLLLALPIAIALIYEFFRLPFLVKNANKKISDEIEVLSDFG